MTAGVDSLNPVQKLAIMSAVREFDEFTPENDPWGEHDCATIEVVDVGNIIWKIDYYDQTLEYGSEDPADLTQTKRVLTIMLAMEY